MCKHFNTLPWLFIAILLDFLVSSNKHDSDGPVQTVAAVTTKGVTEITATTAVCGGEVVNENGWRVTARGVCWSTEPNPTPSDPHTVDGEGVGDFTSEITGLNADTRYYVRAYATNAAGTGFGPEKSFTTESGGIAGHEYVDLGLPSGLLWATCNVGADSPEEYGDYFAWGETVTKDIYDWETYRWCNGSGSSLTKYCTSEDHGTVDNKTVLELADDVAHVNWGGSWRIPTYDEMDELKTECSWEQTTQAGMYGFKVTGSNGNSIFLPAAGCYLEGDIYDAGFRGNYWSGSLYTKHPNGAYRLHFYSGGNFLYNNSRHYGMSVRPVSAPRN
ncbi:MAG: hypothetical protein Q4F69_09490 [Bacteroidia bacterium]|nr:hypothetical protein [Bacteroidia bacterium]